MLSNKRSLVIFFLFLAIAVSIVLLLLKTGNDREARIIFIEVKANFDSNKEKYSNLIKQQNEFSERFKTDYLDYLDRVQTISTDVSLKDNQLIYTILEHSNFSNETIIFELIESDNNKYWTCFKGSFDSSYRPKSCRKE